MSKEYKSRKQMLKEFNVLIDMTFTAGTMEDVEKIVKKETGKDVKRWRDDALSFGTYGMNGGVFSALDDTDNSIVTIAVTERTNLLFKLSE